MKKEGPCKEKKIFFHLEIRKIGTYRYNNK